MAWSRRTNAKANPYLGDRIWQRLCGATRRLFMDHFENTILKIEIDPVTYETEAAERIIWRGAVEDITTSFETIIRLIKVRKEFTKIPEISIA